MRGQNWEDREYHLNLEDQNERNIVRMIPRRSLRFRFMKFIKCCVWMDLPKRRQSHFGLWACLNRSSYSISDRTRSRTTLKTENRKWRLLTRSPHERTWSFTNLYGRFHLILNPKEILLTRISTKRLFKGRQWSGQSFSKVFFDY